jgi:hypothetical protein
VPPSNSQQIILLKKKKKCHRATYATEILNNVQGGFIVQASHPCVKISKLHQNTESQQALENSKQVLSFCHYYETKQQ